MKQGHKTGKIFAFLSVLMSFCLPAFADSAPNNHDSLSGLTSAKAVFDVTTADPKKLNFYLNLIGTTADSMKAEGVTPEFVVSFRGPATLFVSTDRKKTKKEDMAMAGNVQKNLAKLGGTPGVKMEQCAVAAKALKVDPKTINPSVKVIGNSWISLIGYQNKGYALVPVR